MPQFDPGVFPTQLFWLVISFVALYFISLKAVLPKISNVLEARQQKIDDDLDRAAASKQEAQTVLADYEKTLAEGSANAQGLLREATEELAAAAANRHEGLAAKLAQDVRAAEARILEAKTAAIGNINQVAAEVAQSATRRLIGVEVDAAAAGGAVEAVMPGKG